MRLPQATTRSLLFVCLIIWMALGGALLLETIALSMGVARPASPATSAWVLPFAIQQAYRYFGGLGAIVCSYLCLAKWEPARRAAVFLLGLDLVLWLVTTLFTLRSTPLEALEPPRVFLQVVVILFEVGLLRLLLVDHIKGDFQRRESGVRSPDYE